MSADGLNEPLTSSKMVIRGGDSGTQKIVANTLISSAGGKSYYTPNVDIWLQPGSVAYYGTNGSSATPIPFVSDYTDAEKHVYVKMNLNTYIELIVPGYIADGLFYDGLDMGYPDGGPFGYSDHPYYRIDNFQQAFEWGDDYASSPSASANPYTPYQSNSLERQLAFAITSIC